MKPELLEPLLLDRALGELSPEVAALLDEHLARDPEAARLADEFDHTLVAARAATRLDTEPPPPPALDHARLQRMAQAARAAARRRQWFQLAACLALGAVAGWLAHPAPVLVPPAGTASEQSYAGSPRDPVNSSAGLWSRSRIVAEHTGDRPSVRPHQSQTPARSPFPPHSSRKENL